MAAPRTPRSAAAQLLPARTDRPKHLKPTLARVAKLARHRAGLTQRELARVLNLQHGTVGRIELAHARESFSLLHVLAGPRAWAEVLISWLAAAHDLQLHPAPHVEHGDDMTARLSELAARTTAALRALAPALAGELADEELSELAKESRAALQAFLELERWIALEQGARERELRRAERNGRTT